MKNETANRKSARPTVSAKTAWLMGVDLVTTGEHLHSIRRKNHLTQEMLSELFEQAGDPVSRNSISYWETGKKLPSVEHLVFLAELYRCSLDELIFSFRRSRSEENGDQPVPLNITLHSFRGASSASLFFFSQSDVARSIQLLRHEIAKRGGTTSIPSGSMVSCTVSSCSQGIRSNTTAY